MDAVKNISLTIPYGMYKSLKVRSERAKLPYSEIVRMAIDEFLRCRQPDFEVSGR